LGPIHIDKVADRVSSLPPHLCNVLACISEGMSNGQIAEVLNYKNARTVGSLIYEINKKLGLKKIRSATQKRQVAGEAFRAAETGIVRIRILPSRDAMIGASRITFRAGSANRVSSLSRQGYEIEALEVIFRKPPIVPR
jgi:regulatory LuxR family protein